MAAKYLKAEHKPSNINHYHFQIHLDDTKFLADGVTPDPQYVREYHWQDSAPKGWTGASLNGTQYTDWLAYVQAETQLLAQAALAHINASDTPTVLAAQGTTF